MICETNDNGSRRLEESGQLNAATHEKGQFWGIISISLQTVSHCGLLSSVNCTISHKCEQLNFVSMEVQREPKIKVFVNCGNVILKSAMFPEKRLGRCATFKNKNVGGGAKSYGCSLHFRIKNRNESVLTLVIASCLNCPYNYLTSPMIFLNWALILCNFEVYFRFTSTC